MPLAQVKMVLTVDDWSPSGDAVTRATTPEPTEADIRAAVTSLDDFRHTLLTLESVSGSLLQVGGKPGYYLVGASVFHPAERHFVLLNGAAEPNATVELSIGRQTVEHESEEICSFEDAIREALYFAAHGKMSTNPLWMEL